jgi:hypothetical protein
MRIALDEKDLCDILATHLGLAGLEGAEIRIDIENDPFGVVITGLSVNQLVNIHATLSAEQDQEQDQEQEGRESSEGESEVPIAEDTPVNPDVNLDMGAILANSAQLLNQRVPGRVPKESKVRTPLILDPDDLR